MQRLLFTASVAFTGLLLAPAAHAVDGEQWEYTMTFDAAGVSMPMGKAKACHAASSSLKPRLAPNCKLEDFKPSGNKATFRAVCGPPQPSTMSGEMTRTGDTLSGTLRMQQDGNDVLIKQTARKLGSCTNPID
jgi:Protein of unknown function (DUF3617)